jgi:hypothetical protein
MNRARPLLGAVLLAALLDSGCGRQTKLSSAASGLPGSSPELAPSPAEPIGRTYLGITAIQPRWTQYRGYLQHLAETVKGEWDAVDELSGGRHQSGSRIGVTFVLNSMGHVSNIVGLEHSEPISARYLRACLAAINNQPSYGPWTEGMIATLGRHQEMTMVFYYEGAGDKLLMLTGSEAALKNECFEPPGSGASQAQ